MSKKNKFLKLAGENATVYLAICIIVVGAFLRLIGLGQTPGLYFDEVLYGLDANSILKTGKDIYGHFMPLAFQSSGYYPLLYPYTLVPFLAVFGLSAWVVRLPAALAGIVSLAIFFLLVKETAGRSGKLLALIGVFILAYLPWHIHLTRVSFLSGFGLAFLLAGTYFFIRGQKDSRYFILGTLLMAASTQAHYGYMLLAPIMFIELCILEYRNLIKHKHFLFGIIAIWVGVVAISAVSHSRYNSGFRVTELVNRDVFSVVLEYFRSFSLNYLFINGTDYRLVNPWKGGALPLIMLPYVLLGLVRFFRQNKTVKLVIGSFLLLTPIPSAIANSGQHSIRNSPMIIAFVFLAALGVELLLHVSRWKIVFRVLVFASALIFLVNTVNKVGYLFTKYSFEYGDLWGDNQRAAIEFANGHQAQNIVFIDSYNVMLSYFAFGQKTSPALVQKTILLPIGYNNLPAKNIDNAYFLTTEQGFDRNYLQNLPANSLVVDTLFYSDSPLFRTVKIGDRKMFQYFIIK